MEIFGVGDELYGVKASVYSEKGEERGVFFSVDARDWGKVPKPSGVEEKKKKTRKYNDEFAMIKNYEINSVMRLIGWDVLIQALLFTEESSSRNSQLQQTRR